MAYDQQEFGEGRALAWNGRKTTGSDAPTLIRLNRQAVRVAPLVTRILGAGSGPPPTRRRRTKSERKQRQPGGTSCQCRLSCYTPPIGLNVARAVSARYFRLVPPEVVAIPPHHDLLALQRGQIRSPKPSLLKIIRQRRHGRFAGTSPRAACGLASWASLFKPILVSVIPPPGVRGDRVRGRDDPSRFDLA